MSGVLKHHSENNHLSFLFFLGGRPFCMNSQRRTFNEQRHYGYAGTDDGPGTDQTLDTKRLTLMSGSRRAPQILRFAARARTHCANMAAFSDCDGIAPERSVQELIQGSTV